MVRLCFAGEEVVGAEFDAVAAAVACSRSHNIVNSTAHNSHRDHMSHNHSVAVVEPEERHLVLMEEAGRHWPSLYSREVGAEEPFQNHLQEEAEEVAHLHLEELSFNYEHAC